MYLSFDCLFTCLLMRGLLFYLTFFFLFGVNMNTEQIEIQAVEAVEVAPKAKAKKAQTTTKPVEAVEVAPKAKAKKAQTTTKPVESKPKSTPQAALDKARLELATVYARVKILRADYKAAVKNESEQSTISAKRVVLKDAQLQLSRKLKSRYIKARGLAKYLSDNSFETNSVRILSFAEKLAESARMANGNILDSNKHVGAGFFDALACVGAILGRVEVPPLAQWSEWLETLSLESGEYLITSDFRDVCSFMLSKFAPKLIGFFEYIRRMDKANESDDLALHDSLMKVNKEYTLPKCFIGDARNALHALLTRLCVEDIKRGEVIKPLIVDGVEALRPTLKNKDELRVASERVSEREAALQDNLVSSCPFDSRVGIFSGINALTRALESGLKAAKNKAQFTIGFFIQHNRAFLQSALDDAIGEAIKGALKADKSQLSALNSLVSAFSIEITPSNAAQTSEYILGGADIVRYVQFCCPWLGYKKDDGGFFEKPKSASPKTAHIGAARPIWRGGVEGDVVQYPAITLVDYLRLLKTVSKETRVKNQAIRKANSKLSEKQKA